jgi:hypothetical protein
MMENFETYVEYVVEPDGRIRRLLFGDTPQPGVKVYRSPRSHRVISHCSEESFKAIMLGELSPCFIMEKEVVPQESKDDDYVTLQSILKRYGIRRMNLVRKNIRNSELPYKGDCKRTFIHKEHVHIVEEVLKHIAALEKKVLDLRLIKLNDRTLEQRQKLFFSVLDLQDAYEGLLKLNAED